MLTDFPAIAPGASVAEALRHAPLDTLENRILLGHVLQLSRIQLITQAERQLTAEEADWLTALLRRRLHGEPVAYLVGAREFYGLALNVTPAVLIPRPETELLVELALERLPPQGQALDMGTGSGAIAVAIAHTRPDVAMTALDVSAAALAVATGNAKKHAARVTFLQSDWYAALERDGATAAFDVILANPPYIVAGDEHLSQGDLRFEPISALTDHADGLSALRAIIDGAGRYLKPAGWLLLEHGYDQAKAVRDWLKHRGFANVQSWRDLSGIDRVSGGRAPAA